MNAKTCKQCGELKPISQYRQYYGGRRGTYTMCKDCERINSREKYLTSKGDTRTPEEDIELMRIHKLYECQLAVGLQPPVKQGRRKPLTDDLDSMIQKYTVMRDTEEAAPSAAGAAVPYELTRWLSEPLTKEPDYYLDEVYEELTAKYRPARGINRTTMMPEYDNTYRDVLESILGRFNEYEDSYYEGSEG